MAQKSEIMNFYSNTNILITGGSGFLGKMLIQKLLATHDDLEAIYVIIRSKENKSHTDRFNEVLRNPVFELLRQKKPTFAEKICVLNGDVTQPGLGLNSTDRKTLTEMVDIVFHCAANLNMNAKLKSALETNVKPTYKLLDLCYEMKRLKSLVVVSTAYSNCNISSTEEKIYKSIIPPDILMKLVDDMEEAVFDRIALGLTHDHPNAYTFAKNISEQVLLSKRENLPAVLFRPSIVLSSYTDPIPGWTDNFNGPNAIAIMFKLGIGRVFFMRKDCKGDIVPVDYCVNALICSAWDAVNTRLKATKGIPVYCYSAGPKYSFHWDYIFERTKKNVKCNLNGIMWKPLYILTDSARKHSILDFFLHVIPAYVIDILIFIIGGKTRMKSYYKNLSKVMSAISYFTTREWDLQNDNIYSMWNRMSDEEKIFYPFHIASVDFKKYFETYFTGIKIHALEESLDNVSVANMRYQRLVVAHYALVFGLCFAILWVGCILIEYLL